MLKPIDKVQALYLEKRLLGPYTVVLILSTTNLVTSHSRVSTLKQENVRDLRQQKWVSQHDMTMTKVSGVGLAVAEQ